MSDDADEFGSLHTDPSACPMWYDWCRCTPQAVLVRARELREKRSKAYDAWRVSVNTLWNHYGVSTHAAEVAACREWEACHEDYRQFLIAVGASNLDEIVARATSQHTKGSA